MIQRQLRLRHRNDFAVLRAEGLTHQDRLCVLSYRPNGLTHNRYGFIVMRRLGKAVVRNRIRRLMREVIRQHHPSIKPGYDIALIGRAPLAEASLAELSAAVLMLLARAELIEEDNAV